jgi:hypothetical protein
MCLLVCVEQHLTLLRMIEARSPISNALSSFALSHLFPLSPLPDHVDILLAPRFPVEVCTGLLWTRVGVHLRELPKRYSTLSQASGQPESPCAPYGSIRLCFRSLHAFVG